MARVHRSAIVPYSAEQMFALVDDVESYPDFLPWCTAAEVHRENGAMVEASLELTKSGVSKRFTTRNRRARPVRIDMGLVDGPFSTLEGGWRFDPLGDNGCKVTLDLKFRFSNPVVGMVFGSYFEETCNSLVEAFSARADDVYAED